MGGLRFGEAAEGSGRLVFGDGPQGPVVEPALVEVDATLPELDGLVLRVACALDLAGEFAEFQEPLEVLWDANVSRSTVHQAVAADWQTAQPVAAGVVGLWQQSQALDAWVQTGWQAAVPQAVGLDGRWQAGVQLRHAGQTRWQSGAPRGHALTGCWQEGVRLRAAVAPAWQAARVLRHVLSGRWQEMQPLRTMLGSGWQQASGRVQWVCTGFAQGVPVWQRLGSLWQEAWRPPPGVSPVAGAGERPPEVCFDPLTLGRLVFSTDAVDGCLLLVCHRAWGVLPPAAVFVPARRSYIVINSIEVRRADDLLGAALPAESFQMQLDRNSWTWSFSATFHARARDALALGMDGQPLELEARINGQPFRLYAERVGRSRRFPEHVIAVSGRGLAAVLDAPHAAVQTFSQPAARTASQLMQEVLTFQGVGLGWAVDWQLQDWLVPGGVWMHQGTYMSALKEIAGAVGGYVQPHDTDAVLRVLPAWPLPWWQWAELVPDVELPEGVAEMDETEVLEVPEYNRIIVTGERDGVCADLSRTGTAGDVLKQPMAVHALITDLAAARQRAVAELGASGRMLKHQMTLPVLPATGVIKPGVVLRYVDDASVQRLGVVRAVQIRQQWPVLTQSLEIDSHV